MLSRNCLSYWFPKLQAAGVPVPRTKIVMRPDGLHEPMMSALDGLPFGAECDGFFRELAVAVEEIGLPCFLRTGQTSGKHNWSRTCYVADAEKIRTHVVALIEFSECCDFLGLPWNVWCVRELLPTKPLLTLGDYGNFPVVKEFRYFVSGGSVVCRHPYWPLRALQEGMTIPEVSAGQPLRRLLDMIDRTYKELSEPSSAADALAQRVAAAFDSDGAWSVDVLSTESGWYVTDMAEAARSFHWEGCQHAEKFMQQQETSDA